MKDEHNMHAQYKKPEEHMAMEHEMPPVSKRG